MKKPAPTEHEIQAAIVDALRVAGFVVYETTAYRQKGGSGVDKGIPDLLVAHDAQPGLYLGIEVKRSEDAPFSSPEQERAHAEGRFHLVWTPGQALSRAHDWVMKWDEGVQVLHDHAKRVARMRALERVSRLLLQIPLPDRGSA